MIDSFKVPRIIIIKMLLFVRQWLDLHPQQHAVRQIRKIYEFKVNKVKSTILKGKGSQIFTPVWAVLFSSRNGEQSFVSLNYSLLSPFETVLFSRSTNVIGLLLNCFSFLLST